MFVRDFPEAGLVLLNKRPAWWQDLLDARFTNAIGQESPLFLAVREDYLNAYVEGQSISKIEFNNNYQHFGISIHHKYILDGVIGQKYLYVHGPKAGDVPYHGPSTLCSWIKRAQILAYRHQEKKGVAVIVEKNRHVIDVEMALPGHASRIDMVALERHDGAIRIVFYEAKCSHNKSLVSNTEPRVIGQLRRYAEWLGEVGREKLLVTSYRRACQVLIKLRTMQSLAIDPLVCEAAEKDSNLIVDPAPRLVIFGDDPPNWASMHKLKLEQAGLRLIMAPSADGISLPMVQ